MSLLKTIKQNLGVIRNYLKNGPDNIKKYKEWKNVIQFEEESYYSKFNSLRLHTNGDKTVVWQFLNLEESEERYWDWTAKNNKLMSMIQPTVNYLQNDLSWGEYLTYDIAHVENKDNPDDVIMTYLGIFKFTPTPLPEEGLDYNAYVKKYKKIKYGVNLIWISLLIILGSLGVNYFLL